MSEAVALPPFALAFPRAHARDADEIPWVPLSPGFSIRPLRFFPDGAGYAAILRLEPGAVIPPHRHTGEIHAINMEGRRELVTGEVIGPGDYVYEPAGNVDSWWVVGEQPVSVFVVLKGAVEYLAPDGTVIRSTDGRTLEAAYRAHCAAHGLAVADLSE